MALSNWDTLSWTHKGEPCDGSFSTPLGIAVHVRKNWLYVADQQSVRDGSSYLPPTVMQVDSGSIVYHDLRVRAVRGPQQGVYAALWTGYGDDLAGIVAIGVYGYDQDSKWVGVLPSSVDWLMEDALGLERDERDAVEPAWRLLQAKPVQLARFNQGDAYFAKHLGTPVPTTTPGEVSPPTLMGILDAMTGKKPPQA